MVITATIVITSITTSLESISNNAEMKDAAAATIKAMKDIQTTLPIKP